MLFPLMLSQAHAFCGYYAGEAGASHYNQLSQIAMVRQDGRTTLTLANDIAGDATEFALIIPVPEILSEDDVRIADSGLFAMLDDYSAPRLVEYTCESIYGDTMMMADSSGSGGSGGSVPPSEPVAETESSVSVEAEFAVGEYEIVILSAEESGDLLEWLEENGYAIGDDAAELLGEYIDSGSYFFAAKVVLEMLPGDGVTLSPLQFSYESDVFALPIRLGTLNSPGEQDLILYTLTTTEDGSVAIANYPEVEVEDECLWDGDDFAAFYPEVFAEAIDEAGGSAWMEEYSWSPYKCDPCVGEPPTQEEIDALGFDGLLEEAHFTRLHMRYDNTITADLSLYATRISDWEQIRYVTWTEEIEYLYPICGAGWVEDPGECPGGYTWWTEDEPWYKRLIGGGCSTVPSGGSGMLAVLLGMLIGLRRRSDITPA